MRFEFKGKAKIKGNWKPFTREIISGTEKSATDKIYSLFGSEHALKRRFIIIDSVQELKE